jgi:hypothetical protein
MKSRGIRSAFSTVDGKPVGKIPLGRPRRRWKDNIKMDVEVIGCEHVEWI